MVQKGDYLDEIHCESMIFEAHKIMKGKKLTKNGKEHAMATNDVVVNIIKGLEQRPLKFYY